jgi:hypothetical protein
LGRRQVAKGCLIGTQRPDGSADPAAIQTKLGIACAQRANGNRPENLKLAFAGFEDALSGLTRERNHGVALPTSRDVRDNDRSQELTRLRDSLQELTDLLAPQRNCESAPRREKVPEEDPGWEDPGWATARMNLGVAYRDRLVGNRSDNLKRAICAIEDSLSVWTRERNPEHWAAARMNIGITCWQGIAGYRSENRERAIGAFADALSVWTRETNPEGWAGRSHEPRYRLLGTTCRRPGGEPGAGHCLLRECSVGLDPQAPPERIAAARANLETACRERFGEWLENRVASGGPVAQRPATVSLPG